MKKTILAAVAALVAGAMLVPATPSPELAAQPSASGINYLGIPHGTQEARRDCQRDAFPSVRYGHAHASWYASLTAADRERWVGVLADCRAAHPVAGEGTWNTANLIKLSEGEFVARFGG